MNKRLHHPLGFRLVKWLTLSASLILPIVSASAQDADSNNDDDVFELSPFVVDASDDMGYYASQSLAGGRLSTDIINTGTSIEVVTQDFMDDIGANDIQELLQYTNNTEIGGVLGNFAGVDVDPSQGNVNTQSTQRNPDANSRIRGLSSPDNTRDFFKTNIPSDQYNTERIDINRGSNSFLFGLGSPSGLINSQLSKAHFNDRSEIRFRLGSGGERPTYRAEFDFNRSVIKDKLAIRIASMMNRQQYRQEPTFRDDDRIYAAFTYHPFDNNKRTTIRGHYESGNQHMNNASTVLPQESLSTWIKYRIPIDVDYNTRIYRQQYGPNQGDINPNPPRFDARTLREIGSYWADFELIDESDPNSNVAKDSAGNWILTRPSIGGLIGNMNANGYSVVFDGSNGDQPGFVLQNQWRGISDTVMRGNGSYKKVGGKWTWNQTEDGDAWWSPDGRTNGNPTMRVYRNSRSADDRGVGWFNQGITDLEMFDFTKQLLSGENDFVLVDFYNYNFAFEQIFLDGKAGVEVAYNFENHVRDTWTAMTGGGGEIFLDINQTMTLPYTDANGNVLYPTLIDNPDGALDDYANRARENPNFGRPFVVSKAGRGWNRNDRQSLRATAFYKLDFEEYSEKRGWMKWLGAHTFSVLGDNNVEEYEYFGRTLRSFAEEFDVGKHLWDGTGRNATTAVRNVPRIVYVGPPVQSYLGDSVWDPNTPLSMSDLIIEPVSYDLLLPEGTTMPMMYWNKGADATAGILMTPQGVPILDSNGNVQERTIGHQDFLNGDESWQSATFAPQWVPDEGVQIRHTEIKSWAVNAQSFFLNRHLVINTGYREDYVKNWANKQANKITDDLIPDISQDNFRWQDGEYFEIDKGPSGSGTFGYGAVLHWPKGIIPLPGSTDISFHYNYSENFVPESGRFSLVPDETGYVRYTALTSPQGESTDFGVTFQLFDRKLIVRLNWYENVLIGKDSSLNNVFNQNLSKMFAWYNNNNKQRTLLDSSDGTINGTFDNVISNTTEIESYREEQYDDITGDVIPDPDDPYVLDPVTGEPVIDPDTGLPQVNPLMETDQMVIDRRWPNWDRMVSARNDLYNVLQSGYWQLKLERDRLQINDDGSITDQWLNGLTDLEDIVAEGFEASITFNPTRNWRMRINVARQETTASNIAPRLKRFVEEDWLPWVIKYGDLDWNDTARVLAGDTIAVNVNENLLKYFTVQSLDGFPSDEVREWRVNLVTNYSFREGRLKGWNIGGSMRYQSDMAIGYPLIWEEVLQGSTIQVGDVENPWRGEELISFDLQFGYQRKIWDNVNWQIQVNLRNLQNIDSDNLSPVQAQPDGSYAKVKWDPPFQWQITSTFRW